LESKLMYWWALMFESKVPPVGLVLVSSFFRRLRVPRLFAGLVPGLAGMQMKYRR
jgi:hypothetical protein